MAVDANTIYLDPGLSNAGCTGIHQRQDLVYLAAAPQTAAEFNKLRLPVEAIACWRMDDARFDFDSSFIMPAAIEEFGLLRAVVNENPNAPLTVFGHADPVGTDDYNKNLSGRRARVVYAALVRNTAVWEDLYSNPMQGDKWDDGQITDMLGAILSADGAPYFRPGGQIGDALSRFRVANNLPATGGNDGDSRAKLFRAYMDHLCNGIGSGPSDRLELSADRFLAGSAGSVAGGKGNYQGCGRFNPVLVFSNAEDRTYSQPENHHDRNAANSVNRRVTIFLFAPGTRVDPNKWPCPAAADPIAGCRLRFFPNGDARRFPGKSERLFEKTHDTFACRFYQRLAGHSPCEGASQRTTFRLRLCDVYQNPIPGAPCRILQGNDVLTVRADQDAFVLAVVRRYPNKVRVEWTKPEDANDHNYPFALEIYVAPVDGEEGGFQRLHNVGYSRQRTLKDKVRAYQLEFGRTVTGNLDDISEELRTWHDGGPKPPVSNI